MPQSDRAKQFASFDALKGLQEMLKMKEYEHERITKGDVSEEQAKHISDVLLSLQRADWVNIKFFDKGYICSASGVAKLLLHDGVIMVNDYKIEIQNILDVNKITKQI